MILTAQVALAAVLVRSIVEPLASDGASLRWVAVTIGFALASWAMLDHLTNTLLGPGRVDEGRRCPRCRRADLRPIVPNGRGLFDPVDSYRCGACGTEYREQRQDLVEAIRPPSPPPPPPGPPPIRFLEPEPARPIDPTGIEFLAG